MGAPGRFEPVEQLKQLTGDGSKGADLLMPLSIDHDDQTGNDHFCEV